LGLAGGAGGPQAGPGDGEDGVAHGKNSEDREGSVVAGLRLAECAFFFLSGIGARRAPDKSGYLNLLKPYGFWGCGTSRLSHRGSGGGKLTERGVQSGLVMTIQGALGLASAWLEKKKFCKLLAPKSDKWNKALPYFPPSCTY